MKSVLALAICLVLLIPAPGHSNPVSEQDARVIGENFIDFMLAVRGSWGEAGEAQITDIQELRRGDLLLGYHLSVYPAGHMVVPAVRALSPVKSFSFTEDYGTESEEGYWQLLKDAMEHTLLALEDRYGPLNLLEAAPAPKKTGDQWDWLLGGGTAPASIDTVGPLIKTHWEQGTPYNNNCPMGDGGRCVVGCVATAGCQTMRYWRHPSYGTGSHSYWWDGDQSCGGSTADQTLSADFDHPYDWWNMKRRYDLGYDSTQAAAVAQLCSDVGIAWEMDYGRCGSGAYTARGLIVYPTWFKYLPTISRHDRADYPSAEAWFARMRQEFDANPPRPIHYRIYGHSINCDGYMDAGINYIHLNYGWGGSHDDWYAVDSLYCSWSGCDPMEEYMMCGIEPGADFIEITNGPLADEGNTYGVAWTDYDGDGDPDLYLSNSGSANKLLRNDGAGVFTDVTSGPLGDTGHGRAAVWADYDHDGDPDVYLCKTSGESNRLLRNDGGAFVDVTSGPLGDSGDSESAAWADYDFDGDLDLYVVNNGSANRLLENLGGDVFADATAGPLGDAGSGYGVAWGDYDNDNDPDLYLVNAGANKLLRNQGGVFVDVTTGPLGDAASGRGAAWGDYDNDGDLDLYLTNHGSANKLLRNDGPGGFTDATASPLDDIGNGAGAAWGDCDNDGDLDLYLSNQGGSSNKIFRNRGGGEFQDATVVPLGDTGNGLGVAWADYDGDGLVDLYVGNRPGANLLFHNEYQPDKHWLQVRLVGTTSNTAGIGARVRAVAGGLSQLREIAAGSGYCSQNSVVAQFGLGDAKVVDTLEVIWPTGAVRDTVAVSADQLVILNEPDISGLSRPVGIGPGPWLSLARPNPFGRSTTIRYSLPQPSAVSLKVYDVSGRLVKVLVDGGHYQPGEHSAEWDGTNATGQEVSSGIYFCRLEAGSVARSQRLLLLH